MNAEWIVTGVLLLGAMVVCGTSLYLKKRKDTQIGSLENKSDVDESKLTD
jgi:hypothetical protein